jgi:hypothetical protein
MQSDLRSNTRFPQLCRGMRARHLCGKNPGNLCSTAASNGGTDARPLWPLLGDSSWYSSGSPARLQLCCSHPASLRRKAPDPPIRRLRTSLIRPASSTLPLPNRPSRKARIRTRRALHHASGDRDRRGDKNSDEVAELLQAVIAGPTLVDREVQRRVLDRRRERGREHIPGLRHQPAPLISGKQQHIKGGAIDYPEQVDGEMPPPRQPKSMAKARNAKPRWQSDQIPR